MDEGQNPSLATIRVRLAAIPAEIATAEQRIKDLKAEQYTLLTTERILTRRFAPNDDN